MSKNNLVIVESPNKIKTIQKYLGDDYKVMASVGHIAKLSIKGPMGLGIDLENWEPQFVLDSSKKKIVKELKSAVKDADMVYIATDPDREGEAIGDHLVKFLKCKDGQYSRIRYNEITEDAILRAMQNPGKLDQNLIEAQKARRMLDRIIGFRLSQLIKKKFSNTPSNPSAGRVQSIALKLVVDKEKEIEAFVPRGYHLVEAKLEKDAVASIYMDSHPGEEKNWVYPDKELEEVKKELEKDPSHEMTVTEVDAKKRTMASMTPFKQAVLYKRSPFSSSTTQASAQRLYEGFGEGGLISYPRTDSTRMSYTFINAGKKYVEKRFGKDYVLNNIKGVAGDQDAHEAIRPTDITLTPEAAKAKYSLSNIDYQIYKLIYEHTLCCLVKQPVRMIKNYTLQKHSLTFKITCSKVIFPGYYKVKGNNEDTYDPEFEEGQKVKVLNYDITDHETKPPARYTDGSLIEKLDEIKVGRPSTFSSTVKIIINRRYVSKKGGSLHPTEFGKMVIDKLITGFPDIINEGYTAEVEEQLDLIADNKITVQPVMVDFYNRFEKNYEYATQTLEYTAIAPEVIEDRKCPKDNGILMIKHNRRYGTKFIACDNFPKCKYTENYEDPDNPRPKRRFFRKAKK